MKLTFKIRAWIHFLITLAITVALGAHIDSFFVFIVVATPIWFASYILTKVTLEPYEAEGQ